VGTVEYCAPCQAKGKYREKVRTFRGEPRCAACVREWIEAYEKAPHHMAELSSNLRKTLKKSGYSAREISSRVGVGELIFGRYMKSDGDPYYSVPGLRRFVEICLVLGTTPNELLGFTDPRFKEVKAERDRYLGVISQIHSIADLRWAEQEREAIARSGLIDGLTPTQAAAARAFNGHEPDAAAGRTEPDFRT
jgi:transcriptional regulator with XRE-family HTH domain